MHLRSRPGREVQRNRSPKGPFRPFLNPGDAFTRATVHKFYNTDAEFCWKSLIDGRQKSIPVEYGTASQAALIWDGALGLVQAKRRETRALAEAETCKHPLGGSFGGVLTGADT